jgi:PD-(D/E)XK nuclease superfamily
MRNRTASSSAPTEAQDSLGCILYRWQWHLDGSPRVPSTASRSSQLASFAGTIVSSDVIAVSVMFRLYDGDVDGVLTQQALEAAHCWETEDRVPGRPEMTEFRRRLRYHQAQWREAQEQPIGSQPIAPRLDGGPARLVGSRLPLAYARETGANFLTASALEAARARTSVTEPHQSFDHQGLWADLLSSPALAFNLFGDPAADLVLADRAAHTWWPDAPGTVSEVRFAHSPGRLDPAYLNSLRAFDAAFVLDLGDSATQGIIGVDTKYHERTKSEIPKPGNLWRYLEVAERSGAFAPEATDAVKGRSDLCVMWLEHLLLLSMLQHVGGVWTWGRYVIVHPAGNSDVADACARYRDLLVDQSTFASVTVEELLDASVLPKRTATALRKRYLPS